jgi:error-prone DNA polymerase
MPSQIPYAELHCKTNFSFLEGASHADELVARGIELGYAALAVTDRNSLSGVVRAHTAAKEAGLKLLIGAQITPSDAAEVILWAPHRAAYGQLSRMITVGRRQAPKGEFLLRFAELAANSGGLLCGVPLARGPHDAQELTQQIEPYRELLTDRCYLVAELLYQTRDAEQLALWQSVSKTTGVPLVAAGDVCYHEAGRLPLVDSLTAIREGITIDEAGEFLFPNAERRMKSPAEIASRFAAAPHALARTVEIADRCQFSLSELRYEYPEELVPDGTTPSQYLAQLVAVGAQQRYPQGTPPHVADLVAHELAIIADLQYEAYFLTVYDLVRYARERGILCQGRGSAANSAVCYCLGVTSVNPECADVLFERFISRERNEAPDIDVDFEHERREEVLQYLYQKYGRERAGLGAEVICYRSRSAVRDLGKALGFTLAQVDTVAKRIEGHHGENNLAARMREAGIDPHSLRAKLWSEQLTELVGFPRHLGQHVGGMVMTRGPLCELVPIENAAMPDRTVIEWDKHDLDDLGILKVDCLALGMLTAIRKCFELIEQHAGQAWTLATVPQEDPAVYEMICRADTMGVFQIESRAQMSMLPRLRPQTFYDLVIEVAIVRPGPIQGNMVHPYLRRREGLEAVSFPNEAIRDVLKKTLGVPLFQEQAMRLAVVAAGFTPGEADQLRRAMGAWRKTGVIEIFRQKLIDGMLARGLTAEFAEQVFRQIRGFGEYGFPESHATSFALLVYVSAWLKCYYPATFTAALLNSQPLGFYSPAQLVRDARAHGVAVLPVDVNASHWDCTLEGTECDSLAELTPLQKAPRRDAGFALRLGLRQVQGIPRATAEQLLTARELGPFASLTEIARRAGLSRMVLKRLSAAGVTESLTATRRSGIWQSLGQEAHPEKIPLLANLPGEDETPDFLPHMPLREEVIADYRTVGLSLRAHPVQFERTRLTQLKVIPAARLAEMKHGTLVRVGGLVLVRQRPGTAKGITFVTLEDETGTANLIIRREVWERFRDIARTAAALIAHGRLQKQGLVIHVLTSKLADLSAAVQGIDSQSRDFH